jgi:hypothetical protein
MRFRVFLKFSSVFAWIALAALLPGCATTKKKPIIAEAAASAPVPSPTPVSLPKPPAAAASKPSEAAPVMVRSLGNAEFTPPPREPSRLELVSGKVAAGRLESASDSWLIFANSKKLGDSSLYEDAITLGKIRRCLKGIYGVSEATLSSATVRDNCVVVSIPAEVSTGTSAKIIDALLKCDGVARVKATFPK